MNIEPDIVNAGEPYINQSVVELDCTPHPIRENITTPMFDQGNSHIAVPASPGLGIDVIEAEAHRFLADGLSSPIRIGT